MNTAALRRAGVALFATSDDAASAVGARAFDFPGWQVEKVGAGAWVVRLTPGADTFIGNDDYIITIEPRETIRDWARRHDFTVIEAPDPGPVVICDLCNADYTERADTGGILVQSKAVCPACAPGYEAKLREYDEMRYLRARCPAGMSFADWVRRHLR